MIDRRKFLGSAALGVSGVYLDQAVCAAAADQSNGGQRAIKNAMRSIKVEKR